MKRLILLLACCGPAFAQDHLWIGAAAYTAANLADGYTTTHFPARCYEASAYLYGRHPTATSYFAPAFGIEAGQVFLAWKFRRSRHRVLRIAASAQLWAATAGHASGFAWNITQGCY